MSNQENQTYIPFEQISLSSLGVFMLYGPIEINLAYAACEFIIKANRLQFENDLSLLINSEGGVVTDGFSIIDAMVHSRIPVSTTSTGLIASMGLLIACAGEKGERYITRNTEVMAHQFAGMASGKYHEMVAVHKQNDQLARKIVKHFKTHSTMDEKTIKDVLFGATDRYLTPNECKKYGLCDQVIEYVS